MADGDEDFDISKQSGHIDERDFDLIAEKLLCKQMLLTALELHTELVEIGCELPRLRDFFSNPGNFERQLPPTKEPPLPRSSSTFTIDSLDDFSRFSDDGNRVGEERVAVLEFELRKAHETIKALRGSLTEVAGSDSPSVDSGGDSRSQKEPASKEEPMKPHEKRAINFLVNEYLLHNDYKLASVTFSDENAEQDFDDWDDVGLNTPKPPDLLHLYRDYGHHTIPEVTLVLKTVKEEKEQVEEELVKLQAECKRLHEEAEELTFENRKLGDTVQQFERDLQEMTAAAQASVTPSVNVHDAADSSTQQEGIANHDTTGALSSNSMEVPQNVVQEEAAEDSQNPAQEMQNQRGDILDGNHGDDESSLPAAILEDGDKHSAKEDLSVSEEEKSQATSTDKGEKRSPSAAFREALLSRLHINLDNRLANEVSKLTDTDENVVLIIARCLPHIVPNVLLNKREELIPVILCTVIHHPKTEERDRLMHMLFNLIKRPDEEQRQMIMNGCAAFAKMVGPTRIETELLPQWWEQISHKFAERRLLVAEACGGLASYLPEEIRSSLVWSMLKQMLTGDRSEDVRETAARSLGLLVTFMENPDKYEQTQELLWSTLFDSTDKVAKAARDILLPSVADWARNLNKLHSHLLPGVFNRIDSALKDVYQLQELSEEEVSEEAHHTLEVVTDRLCTLLRVLTLLIPQLFVFILQSAPFAKTSEDVLDQAVSVSDDRFLPSTSSLTNVETIIGSKQLLSLLTRRFDESVTKEAQESWDALSWVSYECLRTMCDIVGKVPVSLTDCVQQLILMFRSFCITFGRPYTEHTIRPYCLDKLNFPSTTCDEEDQRNEVHLVHASLPVVVVGLLGCFDSEENKSRITSYLRASVIGLAQSGDTIAGPEIICQELSVNPVYQDLLVEVLWEIVVHQDHTVRCCAAPLFTVLIKSVEFDMISRRVLPALVTLASDSHMSVRAASIPAFGTIVEHVPDKTILEKVYVQFQSFLEDPQYKDQVELQVTMIRTFGKVAPHAEPHFRDEVLLPRLAVMATINSQLPDEARRRMVALELLETYISLTCCFISPDVLNDYIIPGLRSVKQDILTLAPDYEETLSVLLQECEAKLEQKPFMGVPTASSTIGQDIRNTFKTGFHRLKEVSPRPRMSDIFKKREKGDSSKSF